MAYKDTINLICIKTCNAPQLLDRCLNSICRSALYSQWKQVEFMVYDDSDNSTDISDNNQVIKEIENKLKISIEYKNKKDTRKLIEINKFNVPENHLAYIFSDFRSLEKIGGFNGAHNASLLHAKNFIQNSNLSADSVITVHDDDILYSKLEYNTCTNMYEFSDNDYIFERMSVYANNPEIVVSSGKCSGHSGSPISILRQFLQYVTLALELSTNIVPPDARSPFAKMTEGDLELVPLTNKQVYKGIEEVVVF